MNNNIIHNDNGDLTILKEWSKPHINPNYPNAMVRMALVRCYCGKEFVTWKASLVSKNTKSCGCYRAKKRKEALTTHGHCTGYETPTYKTWKGIKRRCLNPSVHSYSTTENPGIKVYDAWLTFGGFLKDMGEKPLGHRLNRINKDGDFEPNNCEWVRIKNDKTNEEKEECHKVK
jgi:hypothetical protein